MKKEITHDEAIALVTSRLQKEGYTVFSNPSSQKENRIGDCYPDVIACNFKNEVKLIVEVETLPLVRKATYQVRQMIRYSKHNVSVSKLSKQTSLMEIIQSISILQNSKMISNNKKLHFITWEVMP